MVIFHIKNLTKDLPE